MLNKYTAQKLIEKSRYKNYYKKLEKEKQEKIKETVTQLIKENTEYCDKGNYKHISNIFTAIAIYQKLQENKTKNEAYEIISHQMWSYTEKKSETMKKFVKIPYSLKIIGILLPTLFKNGSGYGWQYTWHTDKTTNNYLQFECNKCIYQQIFSKYKVEELGPMFCHVDNITYGHLDKIKFTRKHTLCKDGKDCDFLFTRKQ